MSLFQVQGLVKRFGGLLATDHVSLTVEPGEIHALIGPDGDANLQIPSRGLYHAVRSGVWLR